VAHSLVWMHFSIQFM